MVFKPVNPGTGKLLSMMGQALRDGKSIKIDIDGETGYVAVKIHHTVVARYTDAYQAMSLLLPEYAKELL